VGSFTLDSRWCSCEITSRMLPFWKSQSIQRFDFVRRRRRSHFREQTPLPDRVTTATTLFPSPLFLLPVWAVGAGGRPLCQNTGPGAERPNLLAAVTRQCRQCECRVAGSLRPVLDCFLLLIVESYALLILSICCE
jgi:hypothetical protein